MKDQKDRSNKTLLSDYLLLKKRDKARMKEVIKILHNDKAITGADYYHAAMIFQHGTNISHFALARRLARKAVDLKYKKARWLYAASTDRWLVRQGKKQKYGTQFYSKKLGGALRLYSINPHITDKERLAYGVPILADIKKKLVK